MRERKNGVIEWTMRHYQITLLVITVLVGLGIWGLVDMPKQEFPEFTIRQGVVVGVYPGATSGEVEEQLAKPLERYLFTFKEVKKKKTYSMSRDGMVYVMVELNDDVNNKDEVWSKIKLGLQNFKSQLPSGVLAVIANDDFGDTSALLITLESEDKTYRELQRYMETLEDRLRRIESVSNLRRYGVQNEQISVYLDPDKLAAYGLDTRMLMTTLFTQGFTTASGSLENGGLDIPIHLSVTYPSEREVGEQILLADADGHMIRLKDVARIVREYPEPDSYITNNGKKAIILSMGNVAASGGYYISCAANKIIAEPNTLTGSIGIFGMFPNASGLFGKLALTTDIVKTNTFSDLGDLSRPMTESEKALIQGYVERGYQTFLSRCAEGRGMTTEAVNAIGQGRVWTGEQAKERGLVDELGGIELAISTAAGLADLDQYSVTTVSGSKNFLDEFLESQLGEVKLSIIKNVLGNEFEYFKTLNNIKTNCGIQARMPYDMKPL